VRLAEPPIEVENPSLVEMPVAEVPEELPVVTLAPRITATGGVAIPPQPYAPEPIVEVGTIEIPAISLAHKIYQGVTLNNIDKGPSHWTGTALPGEPGNAVFAGHRVTRTRPFRNLDALKGGDVVVFNFLGRRSVYQVKSSQVVEPTALWIADQTPGYTATLYACHPPGSARQRFVVHLEMVAPPA